MKYWSLVILLLATSCSYLRPVPKVSLSGAGLIPKIEANGPKDAGTPTTVDSGVQEKSMKIPAGSTIIETKVDAVPATASTPYRPATLTREIKLVSDTTWYDKAQDIRASTGTIDTSLAKHRIDIQERRWLLWAGIAATIAGIVVKSLLPQWPSMSNGLILAGVALLGAWKFAEIPAWVSLVIIGIVLALVAGYKRAEWDKNSDGVPDFLQKKP